MKRFWDHFDDLFKSVDKMMDTLPDTGSTYRSSKSYSHSTANIKQDGRRISIETLNGDMTIKVDGKKWVPEQEDKGAKNK